MCYRIEFVNAYTKIVIHLSESRIFIKMLNILLKRLPFENNSFFSHIFTKEYKESTRLEICEEQYIIFTQNIINFILSESWKILLLLRLIPCLVTLLRSVCGLSWPSTNSYLEFIQSV